jgi:ABC-2 type transport system permease protein
MKLGRIFAIFLRHTIVMHRDFHRLVDMVYWPGIDIIIWGFNAHWLEANSTSGTYNAAALLTGIIMQHIFTRMHNEVCFSFLDELWSQNLLNLFSSPLTINEWLSASVLLGFFKSLFTIAFGTTMIWLLYDIWVFKIGILIIPFFLSFAFLGFFLGLSATCCLLLWGQKFQSVVWMLPWVFMPFSGLYYPVNILPTWARTIAYCFPMSYLFQALKKLVITHQFDLSLFVSGIALTLAYVSIALTLFHWAYTRSKERGLARLEQYQ